MRCSQKKCPNPRRGNSKGVRKVGSDGDCLLQCMCPLLLYPYGQLPISQLSPCRKEVSAEELVSARWEQSPCSYTLSWAEMDAGESVSCLSGTQIFSEETETAGAGDSARQNMKARNGHDTWWTQTLEEKLPPPPPLSPCARYPSPIAVLHRNKKRSKGKRRDDAWNAVAPSWTLTPCNMWSLIFPKIFREVGSFKETLIGQS